MNKLERKELHLDNLLNKHKELQKKIAMAEREVAYLRQIYEILQSDNAEYMVRNTEYDSGVQSKTTGPVQAEERAPPPIPRDIQGPKKQSPRDSLPEPGRPRQSAWGACSSCGTENSIYHTIRALGNGRKVPLLICNECKGEQIAVGF